MPNRRDRRPEKAAVGLQQVGDRLLVLLRGVMRLPEKVAVPLVSCDVFDTVLHRDHRSESRRFGDIAILASRRLFHECRIVRPPSSIWHARVAAQCQAYRALGLVRPDGDVRFADIVDAMAQILGVDAAAARILHEAEIAVERAQLSANRPLLNWLTVQAHAGTRVVAVSDTYHTAGTIAGLLDALAPQHPISRIHTSADHNATKRAGSLFAAVLKAEGTEPAEVIHIGDDRRADVTMARAAGLRTVRIARPRWMLLRRRSDGLRARAAEALRSPPRLEPRLRSDIT